MKHSRSERFVRFGMRIFYRLLYHRMAWTYDWVAAVVSTGLWQEWVHSTRPYLRGPRVLELGHGPGHLQAALLREGGTIAQVSGLDRSSQMGHMAMRRLMRRGLKANLVNGEAQGLPFASASFDQVAATFPTEYIVDPRTLAEIWRVLAPQGSLVILPVAYITGRRPSERLAAALFRLTGQAPAWNQQALAPLEQAGFKAQAKQIQLKSSTVIVLLAQKE